MGNKYVQVIDSKIRGYYDDEFHDPLPPNIVPISEEVWREALRVNADTYENGQLFKKVVELTEEERNEINFSLREKVKAREAYPLFFKWQFSGEASDYDLWYWKVVEIDLRYPVTEQN